VTVATHTLYHFVRARARKTGARRPSRRQPSRGVQPASDVDPSLPPCSPDRPEDVWTRIAAVKQRAPAAAAEPKAFEFDENEPLQLIAEVKPRKR